MAGLVRPGPPRLLRLDDGTRVVVRAIRPEDKPLLRQAFARSSPATRYRRFLYGKKALTDDDLSYFTEVDGVDHVALVAVIATAAGVETGEPAGVARFIRAVRQSDVAEFAVVVVDARQRRGIGEGLFRALMAEAAKLGVRTLRGYLLADNDAMRALLQRCCGETSMQPEGPLVIADCVLPGPDAAPPSPYPTLRAADDLWWLAAERAMMLPLEYVRAASRLLGREAALLRVLAEPRPGGAACCGEERCDP